MTDTDHSIICVLGAGSWGTALAMLLARNGHLVRLWDRDADHIAALSEQRENRRYLPDIELPD
ncbi:MAG: 2-dehydropantoate 2-reductase N-terminal domain-containing protein, partial [Gammaproteobacteria bacterium]